MVAVAVCVSPPPQHSSTFGHRASSHTCEFFIRLYAYQYVRSPYGIQFQFQFSQRRLQSNVVLADGDFRSKPRRKNESKNNYSNDVRVFFFRLPFAFSPLQVSGVGRWSVQGRALANEVAQSWPRTNEIAFIRRQCSNLSTKNGLHRIKVIPNASR